MKSLDTYELRIGTSPYTEAKHLEDVEAADDEALRRYAGTKYSKPIWALNKTRNEGPFTLVPSP
jgi:hypothetical protein